MSPVPDKPTLKKFLDEILPLVIFFSTISKFTNPVFQAAGTPNAIFNCLKENKDDADFDPNCRKLVVKRIVQQMKDYR